MKTTSTLAIVCGVALALAACRPIPPALVADTILVSGTILTVDEADSIAEAIAIRDGKILAVGTDEEIRSLAGERTEVIDLHGMTATPGLLDAHCHFAWGGTDELYVEDLSYPGVKSLGDVLKRVGDKVKAAKGGEWIQGRGWDEGKLEERRYIYATDLDPISSENPVFLSQTMGHYGVANGLALKLANITKSTPDPPGGTIDRYPDGSPTGVLKESAQDLVTRLIPPITVEEYRRGIEHIATEFSKEGMTGLKEPGIGPTEWEAYQEALVAGNLPVRVFVLWSVGKTVEDAERLSREDWSLHQALSNDRRRPPHLGRGQALRRWKRRSENGLALPALEQGLRRGGRGQLRLPGPVSRHPPPPD